jgi:molecular chaperone DnaK
MNERACESVGIDLGTTYSSLAYMDAQMTPRMVSDSAGQAIVPSVICFDDAGIIVGDFALQQAALSVDRIAQFVKRHMGDVWRQTYQGHEYTPESLSAIILRHLVQEAEPQIGPIRRAVITVPAYFTEKRRLATQQAGEIAGLEVIGTLNEPMAATLAYGLHRRDDEQLVVVYDLGGGTFDVTIVRISPTEIEELATNGNRQLGGHDWDQCLIDYVVDGFQEAHHVDPRSDAQAMQKLLMECELAKRRLSRMNKAPILFHACGRDHVMEITRETFENLSTPLLQTTKITTELALEDAGLGWEQVSRVVLVGGSTHMPAVRKMIKEASGSEPDVGVNPVVAVALGAAIYAQMVETGEAVKTLLHGPATEEQEQPAPAATKTVADPAEEVVEEDSCRIPDMKEFVDDSELSVADATEMETECDESHVDAQAPVEASSLDIPQLPTVRFVTAHGVGVKVRTGIGWKNSVLIPKNTSVPVRVAKRYVTASQTGGGTCVKIQVTQGDTPDIELAEILGTGRIEGFAWHEAPGQPVDVVMDFDNEGRLHINAIYVNTGQEMRISLEIPGGLRAEEVEQQRTHLEETPFLTVFDPDEAVAGLESKDDDDDDFIDPLLAELESEDDDDDDFSDPLDGSSYDFR